MENLEQHFEHLFAKYKIVPHPEYGLIKCFANRKDLICDIILNGSVWEKDLFEIWFKKCVIPDTTILDCGTFIGSHTILMGKLNRNNDFICFEMMPEHYKTLQDNIRLNGIENVLTFNCALSDKLGKAVLPFVDYSTQDSNFGATRLNSFMQSKSCIPVMTLDTILPWITKPVSFIKIDVEGYETATLRGGKQLITKFKPVIAIEIWSYDDKFYNDFIDSDIWKYMSNELNYKIQHMVGDDHLLYVA